MKAQLERRHPRDHDAVRSPSFASTTRSWPSTRAGSWTRVAPASCPWARSARGRRSTAPRSGRCSRPCVRAVGRPRSHRSGHLVLVDGRGGLPGPRARGGRVRAASWCCPRTSTAPTGARCGPTWRRSWRPPTFLACSTTTPSPTGRTSSRSRSRSWPASFPNLEAVKESSADVRRVTAIRALLGDRLDVLVGVDDMIVEGVDGRRRGLDRRARERVPEGIGGPLPLRRARVANRRRSSSTGGSSPSCAWTPSRSSSN